MSKKLFTFDHERNGIKHYKPSIEISIEAISEDGAIDMKPISDFTVHENLEMYRIESPDGEFKTFWVSEDHSLLVYDTITKKVKKIKPLDFKELDHTNWKMIQKVDTSLTTKHINNDNIRLYTNEEITITYDPDKTTAYDFTVEDYFTFRTHDGVYIQDSMACYFTITEEAQQDLKDKMSVENNLFTDYDDTLTLLPGHDIVYGIYLLSKKKASALPEPLYKYMVEKKWDCVNKKRLIEFLTVHIKADKKNVSILDKIMTLGFMISTRYSQIELSVNSVIDSITPIDKRQDLYDRYMAEEITMYQYMAEEEKLLDELKKTCLFTDLIESGSRGSWIQAKQMFLQRGFVSNSLGEVMDEPVMNNLAEGLTSRELFLSCYGVRKGLADVADNTAVSGTFSRGLVYLGLEVKQGDSKKPCKSKGFLLFKATDEDMCKALIGRYIFTSDEAKEMDRITKDNYLDYLNQTIRLRSPIFCTDKYFCHYCSPYKELKDIKKGENYNIGVAAAETLGEPSTQMVLRVFHNSGAVSNKKEDEDQGIVQDLRGVIKLFSHPDFDLMTLSEYIKKVYTTYRLYKQIRMLYFEALISTLMWSKSEDNISNDPDILWRHNQEGELILIGHNKVPALTGFLLGCAFKNFKRILLSSLNKTVGESVFEKLIID